jgi:HlyD family secretion protein
MPLTHTRCLRPLGLCLVAVLAAAGCEKPKPAAPSAGEPPTVRLMQPATRTIVRNVGQPSFVESYERTSIYPKLTAYIEKWNVDIGDKVKLGDVLATLFVPETREDWETKKAIVKLNQEKVALSLKLVDVATADVDTAKAKLESAKAILDKYQSDADRWDSEVKRLAKEAETGVVAPQIVLESKNQFRQSSAARDAAKATILAAEAELLSKEAALAEAKVNVDVAKAAVTVSVSDAKRLEAWVGYLTLTAPFDGIITARNANTGDFVLPATGDPSADRRAPDLSPSGNSAPIYVVDRTDVVRVFVDIPEADANYVKIGNKASVLIRAFRDKPIEGSLIAALGPKAIKQDKLFSDTVSVTRTSWALNVKSRTLRAEIDLPNPDSQILPGMYAYGTVIIERPGVRAVPLSALTYSGDDTFMWRFENGKAVQTPVRTAVTDGEWIEVTDRKNPNGSWTPIDGTEQVILGDLSVLVDGAQVKVVEGKTG